MDQREDLYNAGLWKQTSCAKPELPRQTCEMWRKSGKNGEIYMGPRPQGEGWEEFTLPGHLPYGASPPIRRPVQPYSISELLAIYDEKKGDWCAIARAVESRYISELEATREALAAALWPKPIDA
jgi:hypothetical protein